MNLITSDLSEDIGYSPHSGLFYRISSGKILGTKNTDGYLVFSINCKLYYNHILAYYFVYGRWPENLVDHKNQIKDDNRIENLRDANRSQNAANSKIPSNNSSGVKGVYYDKERRKWCAEIRARGKRYRLGRFNSIEDASRVYKEKHMELFGEYSNE